MTEKVAVVGDIHGNSTALRGMLRALAEWTGPLVFTGDYVNRGPDSSGVIQLLVELSNSRADTFFIAGNHDIALRHAIATGELLPFLSIGGATAISSYVKTPKGDVGQQLRRNVPQTHVDFLENLLPSFAYGSLAVAHSWNDSVFEQDANCYRVYGHTPTPDRKPRIDSHSAAIDTGCGLSTDGPLTCFFWPALTAIQVDALGVELTD